MFDFIKSKIIASSELKKVQEQCKGFFMFLNRHNVCARQTHILLFHGEKYPSLKLTYALPRAIEWLRSQGYAFKVFD